MPLQKYFYKTILCGGKEYHIVTTLGEWNITLNGKPIQRNATLSKTDISLKLCVPICGKGWEFVMPFTNRDGTRELLFSRSVATTSREDSENKASDQPILHKQRLITPDIPEVTFFPSWVKLAMPTCKSRRGGHAFIVYSGDKAIKQYSDLFSDYAINEIGTLQYLKSHTKNARLLTIGRCAHIAHTEARYNIYAFEMPLVKGYDLGVYASKSIFYSREARIEFAREAAREVLEILAIVHSSDIVHGDIKPCNILYGRTCSDDDDKFYLIDFGMSCFNGCSSKMPPEGTVGYASPEITLGAISSNIIPPTFALDIWSLGITLLELVFESSEMNTPPILQSSDGERCQDLSFFGSALHSMRIFGVSRCATLNVFPPREVGYIISNFPEPKTHKELVNRLLKPGSVADSITETHDDFFSFIQICTKFDPELRLSAKELLSHPFVVRA